MVKIFLILNLAVAALFTGVGYADDSNYTISPGVINADISNQDVYQITVINNADNNLKLEVTSLFYPIGEANQGPFSNDKAIGNAKQFDLNPYIVRISPKKMNLVKGDSRVVRIFARIPRDLVPGTYRANIHFAMQPTPKLVSEAKEQKATKLSTEVQILIDQIASIYVNVGNGNAQDVKLDCKVKPDNTLQVEAANNTNWIYNPIISIYPEDASTTYVSSSQARIIPLMPQTEGTRVLYIKPVDRANNNHYKIEWQLPYSPKAPVTTVLCSNS